MYDRLSCEDELQGELTPITINEFVEKISIHERNRKGSQTVNQKIENSFNFIGNYKPSKEERLKCKKEERKIKERKDRLQRNYLKRKESGKQKEYKKRYQKRRE